MARTVSIIGAGRVGASLARILRTRGWRIGAVVTRSLATARAAVRAIGAGTALSFPFKVEGGIAGRRQFGGSELQLRHKGRNETRAFALSASRSGWDREAPEVQAISPLLATDLVLVAVPDIHIAGVASSLARIGGRAWHGKIILHTSGALDRSVLAPLERLGAFTGSLHPMQTFSGRGTPNLKGIVFAVEGDARARRTAAQIARQLGGIPVKIDGSGKAAYHAAGALAAGHALALIEAATRILAAQGFSRRGAAATLLPLTRQMLENFERLGARAAWTGPIARSDFEVVARHAKALRKFPREFAAAYAALAHLSARVLAENPGAKISQLNRALKKS